MAGIKALSRMNFGKELTPGTGVAATRQWRGPAAAILDDRPVTFPNEDIGITTRPDNSYIPRIMASLAMPQSEASYEQLPVVLSAAMKNVTAGAADTPASGYVYSYDVGTTSINTITTWTIETGDNQQAEEMEYSFVTDFTISGQPGEAVMVSANWTGRQATNATFTSATIPVVERIVAQTGLAYLDDVGTYPATTALTNTLLGFTLNVTTGWRPKFFIDGGQLYFSYAYFDLDSYNAELQLTFEHNSTGVQMKADYRAQTAKAIRLQFNGAAVGTDGGVYDNKTLIIDVTGKYTKVDPLTAQEGNNIYTVTLASKYNETEAVSPLRIIVVNELDDIDNPS